jgi:hypothetical protein
MQYKTHLCKQRKQSDRLMFMHSYYVSRILGQIIISKDIVLIFFIHISRNKKSVDGRFYSDNESDRTVTWHW